MLLVALATAAFAASTCPDVPTLVGQARASFDDAELDTADAAVEQAQKSLGCQPAVVPTSVLLDLYRLHVLIDLARQDREGAVYATIREVITEPSATPPAEYGPQLAELHQTWSSRLSAQSFAVKIEGADEAYVDGHRITPKSPMKVLAGEHLIQWKDTDGFHSEVKDLSADYVIHGSSPVAVVPPVPPEPHVIVPPEDLDHHEPAKRRHRAGLLVIGGASTLIGGVASAVAWQKEGEFHDRPYDANQYGACTRAMACYGDARGQQIHLDANRIRAIYGVGYGLMGVGVGTLGAEILLLPAPTGATLGVSVPW